MAQVAEQKSKGKQKPYTAVVINSIKVPYEEHVDSSTLMSFLKSNPRKAPLLKEKVKLEVLCEAIIANRPIWWQDSTTLALGYDRLKNIYMLKSGSNKACLELIDPLLLQRRLIVLKFKNATESLRLMEAMKKQKMYCTQYEEENLHNVVYGEYEHTYTLPKNKSEKRLINRLKQNPRSRQYSDGDLSSLDFESSDECETESRMGHKLHRTPYRDSGLSAGDPGKALQIYIDPSKFGGGAKRDYDKNGLWLNTPLKVDMVSGIVSPRLSDEQHSGRRTMELLFSPSCNAMASCNVSILKWTLLYIPESSSEKSEKDGGKGPTNCWFAPLRLTQLGEFGSRMCEFQRQPV